MVTEVRAVRSLLAPQLMVVAHARKFFATMLQTGT